MALSKIQPASMDLTANYAFTGTNSIAGVDYPEKKLFQGVPIKVGELDPDIKIYWANNHSGYTTGGRVASVVHLSDDLSYSLNKIYNNRNYCLQIILLI